MPEELWETRIRDFLVQLAAEYIKPKANPYTLQSIENKLDGFSDEEIASVVRKHMETT